MALIDLLESAASQPKPQLPAIAPVSTRYKGYHFRSRLEARWAVFFDRMGWEWEYEPEGYTLSDGSVYLPDFLLRNMDGARAFVEVKRDRKDQSKQAWCDTLSKLRKLTELTRVKSVLLDGVPAPEGRQYFCENPRTRKCSLDVLNKILAQNDMEPVTVTEWLALPPYESSELGVVPLRGDQVRAAARAARSARFEHGHSGAS